MKENNNNNEIRFLVTGDLHWTGRNPKARKDDYKESLYEKIEEIFFLAEDQNCEGIIIPGDIFDSPGISYSVLTQLAWLINYHSKQIEVPVYVIAGNHDLYAGNINSLNRTPLGLLSSLQVVNFLHGFNMWESEKISVLGESFNSKITDKDINYYLVSNYDHNNLKAYTNILVTHGMLLERSPGHKLKHTLLRDVAEQPNAPDVLINGHEHNGFGVKKINDTLFINPGSMGRIKATEENLNRQPQVALLTIPASGSPAAELIQLESAASGPRVLSRKHIEEQKRKKEMTKEFLGLLAEEGQSDYMELEDIMSNIADRESLPESVVKEALGRLENEREVMDDERRTG